MAIADLNTHSQATIAFTDNRSPDVVFTIPGEFQDLDITLLLYSFLVQKDREIQEIINSAQAQVVFEIDVSAVTGTTVAWATVPSECTVTVSNGVYSIDGIETVDIWDIVRAPTITVPNTFNGSFFYNCAIRYTNSAGRTAQTWQVGIFIPQALLAAEFASVCDGGKVRITGSTQSVTASLTASAEELQLKEASASFITNTALVASGAIIDVVLAPATGAISYSTNVNFDISNAPLIVSTPTVDDDRFVVFIQPNTTLAITSIFGKDTAATQDWTVSYTGQANPSDKGTDANFVVSRDYTLVGDEEYTGDSNNQGRVLQYDNSTGSLTREYAPLADTSLRFGNSIGISDSYVYIGASGYDSLVVNNIGRTWLYNATTGAFVRNYDNPDSSNTLFGKAVDVNDTYTLTASTTKAYVHRNSNGSLVRTYTMPGGYTTHGNSVKLAGRYAVITATTSTNYYLLVYDIEADQLDSTINLGTSSDDLHIDTSSSFVAAMTSLSANDGDGTVSVYDVTTGNLQRSVAGGVNQSFCVTDRFVATGSEDDNNIKIYDIRTGTTMQTIAGSEDQVFAIASQEDVMSVIQQDQTSTPFNVVYKYDLTGAQVWSNYSGNKLTIVGSKSNYNQTVNTSLEVDPTATFSSNYQLAYNATTADGTASLERLQNVNNV